MAEPLGLIDQEKVNKKTMIVHVSVNFFNFNLIIYVIINKIFSTEWKNIQI